MYWSKEILSQCLYYIFNARVLISKIIHNSILLDIFILDNIVLKFGMTTMLIENVLKCNKYQIC